MRLLNLIAIGALCLAGQAAAAYPDKPVNYFLPFPAGGESDYVARLQQKYFRAKFGKELLIQYKPGAGGGLGWSQLNGMPGDGYNVMGVNLPHIVLQPLEGVVQYKTEDIVPVHFFNYTPDAILVRQDSPFKSFNDLLAAAKANPGKLNIGGSGTNSGNHVAHEKLGILTGVRTTYIPFKGAADSTIATLGGQVDALMGQVSTAVQQKGKLRVLAVAMDKRHPLFPDVPTFRELKIDWVDGAYRGVAMPKSTPPTIMKQVSEIFQEINNNPEFRKEIESGGHVIVNIGLAEMPAFLETRKKDYLVVAKRLGLTK